MTKILHPYIRRKSCQIKHPDSSSKMTLKYWSTCNRTCRDLTPPPLRFGKPIYIQKSHGGICICRMYEIDSLCPNINPYFTSQTYSETALVIRYVWKLPRHKVLLFSEFDQFVSKTRTVSHALVDMAVDQFWSSELSLIVRGNMGSTLGPKRMTEIVSQLTSYSLLSKCPTDK